MRDLDTIDSELRLLAAVRWSIREHGGEPTTRLVDELLPPPGLSKNFCRLFHRKRRGGSGGSGVTPGSRGRLKKHTAVKGLAWSTAKLTISHLCSPRAFALRIISFRASSPVE
jgi:hypothetical protein